jgi:HD-like signal output (HDOD) protein
MLGDFFKRFRSSSTPEVAAGGRPAPARVSPPPVAVVESAPVAPPPTPRAVDVDAREMQGWLELEVRTRVAELHNVLPRVDRESDAPRFLDALLESFDAVVRQPPLAAQRALAVTRDTSAPTSKLVTLVEGDPGLGQALLRYANSAYYATGGGRVVSLHGAVQRVGTSGVHNVVLKTMVDGILCRPGSAYQEYVNLVWQHMIRVAPIARALAPAFRASPDESFALGLLHDVGKLVVFDRLGELRKTLRRDVAFPLPVLTVVLRSLHEPLGGLAALQWGLGAGVAHAIATHHRAPVPEVFDPRGELLFVAERTDLAHARGRALDLDAWWRDGLLATPRDRVEPALALLEQEADEDAIA